MEALSNGVETITTNTSSGNVMSGDPNEFINKPTGLRLMANGDGTTNIATVLFTVTGQVIVNQMRIPGTNRYPIPLEDTIMVARLRPGGQLRLIFDNATAGTIVVQWVIEFT